MSNSRKAQAGRWFIDAEGNMRQIPATITGNAARDVVRVVAGRKQK
jgi:hypothetical protein